MGRTVPVRPLLVREEILVLLLLAELSRAGEQGQRGDSIIPYLKSNHQFSHHKIAQPRAIAWLASGCRIFSCLKGLDLEMMGFS